MLRSNQLSYTTERTRLYIKFLQVYKVGGAFVHKSVHAFFLVLGGKQCVEQTALKHHAIVEAALKGAVDRFLGGHDRDLREAADGDGGTQCFVHQLVKWHHTADQASAFGFGGIHHAGGQGH